MILEEETFTKFGYYPSDLKNKSGKPILAACDGCGKVRVTSKHAYRKICPSCARKGENNPNYGKHWSIEIREKISESERGKHLSEETRRKIGESVKGAKHHMYGKHHTMEARKKMREARKRRRFPKHHTTPELIFEEICVKNNLPFRYVGDGQLWIGKKGEKQLNPDFIEANGKKIVVEIMGNYWHSPLLNPHLREDALLFYRKSHYKEYRWKPIFLWESDLKRDDAEQFVLAALKYALIENNPINSGRAGYDTVKLCEIALESANNNKEIRVEK